MEPCIKGSIVSSVVDDLQALRTGGRLPDAELEARLSATTLAFLERKLSPSDWVPLHVYEELVLLLKRSEGRGDPRYLRHRGERSGERLAGSGLYQQLKFVGKARESRDSLELYKSDLRLILSVQAALINVGKWSVEDDPTHPGRVMFAVREAEPIPDCLMEATAGFLVGVSRSAHEGGIEWRAERPERGRILYRMDRDVADLG